MKPEDPGDTEEMMRHLGLLPILLVLELAVAPPPARAEGPPSTPVAGTRPPSTPVPATSSATTSPAPVRMRAGLDIDVAIPVGALGDAANVGIGALFRYEHAILPKLDITGRAGFVFHLPKQQTVLGTSITSMFWTVPVLAGIRADRHLLAQHQPRSDRWCRLSRG
jgi:hypothetical protein